jgi:hypothetical protein
MNPPINLKEQWDRTSTRRLLRWLFSWTTARALLVWGGGFVTLIVLFYAVENWRGAHALNRYRAECERKGERFNIQPLIPPPVPDDQNFAMTPLLKPVLDYETNAGGKKWRDPAGRDRLSKISAFLRDDKRRKEPSLGNCYANTLTDLALWQAYYRGNTNYPQPAAAQTPAKDVLTALGKFDPELKELQEASARPFARFPVHYGDEDPYALLLPHLAPMKTLANVLALRATARLEAGQPREALADVKLGLRLSDSFKEEPILISHLVRLAMLSILIQPVREGLARHAWNEAELAGLEKQLAGIKLLSEDKHVMRAERAWDLIALDYYQRSGWRYNPFQDGETPGEDRSWLFCLLRIIPTGWVRQNEVLICRLIQDHALDGVDEKARRIDPSRIDGLAQACESMRERPYNFLAMQLVPALGRASEKTARGQTLVDQATVACALECYRLANGQFPEALDVLVPRFIDKVPNDLIDGAPLRYRRSGDGTYLLYSVGWNQKDDGGQMVKKGQPPITQPHEGDWVWPCPVK